MKLSNLTVSTVILACCAAVVSTVETVKIFSDKQIGAIKIVTFANGSAANPVNASLMLESADQRGDNANFDVYPLTIGFVDNIASSLDGDFVMISGKREDSSISNVKSVVLKIQIKKDGKRLPAPVVL